MNSKEAAFQNLKLNPQILKAIGEMGYKHPTEIQEKVIPRILNGQQLIGIAQTGTGKTAAYLLPLLMKLKFKQGKVPRALVLVPTKELSIQVTEEAKKYSRFLDIRTVALYGGARLTEQRKELEAGTDILVSTPGRLMEMYREARVDLDSIAYLILDEADRLMDMGFKPQIRTLLEWFPRKRLNLLFSASFPDSVESFAAEFVDFAERIEVTPQSTPAKTIDQCAFHVPNFQSKMNLLEYLLRADPDKKTLIFCRTRQNVDQVALLVGDIIRAKVRVLHSNKSQNTRINSINAFSSGEVNLMVATDVSARGIDIRDVDLVVNFDTPLLYEDYVHRIGRTGRAGKRGRSVTFANKAEIMHLKKIEKLIRMQISVEEIPKNVEVVQTGREEIIEIEQEIDRIKRRDDPDFKGAFHEKKYPQGKNQFKGKKRSKRK
jgi:ATP-dependent RNA helicase RhlE